MRIGPLDELPAWTDNCILVYGPRKSGTTLLLKLLDGGDELFAYPAEITSKHLSRTDWKQDAVERYRSLVRVGDLAEAGVEMSTYDVLWNRIAPTLKNGDLATLVRTDAHIVAQSIASPRAKTRMWCVKDVGGRTHETLSLWRELFKSAKFIFIVRDPIMITRAVLMERRRRNIPLTWRQIIAQIVDPIRVIKAQANFLGDPHTVFVVYEDLVDDPRKAMQQLAVFAGVPYSECFEVPTSLGKPVVVKTSSRQVRQVFNSQARWQEGLTLEEKILVSLTRMILRFIPRYNVDYSVIRARANANLRSR